MKCLVFGHYGGCNTGDDAMLAGMVRELTLRGASLIYVVTKDGTAPSFVKNVKALGRSPISILQAIRNVDAVVLGGGTHFHDDYTPRRYWRHFRYMTFIVGLSWAARLLGKRIYWLGMGFGPFHRLSAKLIARFGLKSCHGVTVRDRQSYHEVQSWVQTDRLCQAFDLAALLDNISNEPIDSIRDDAHVLGISVTSVQATASGGKLTDAAYWSRFVSALGKIYSQRLSLQVRVFVFRGGNREDDKAISRQVVNSLRAIDPDRVELVSYFDDPFKTLQAAQACSFFIASRFHAGVLAYLAGCRLLLLAYHRKVRDLASEIDLSPNACLPISPDVSEAEIRQAIEWLLGGDPGFYARLPVKQARERAMRSIEMMFGNHEPCD